MYPFLLAIVFSVLRFTVLITPLVSSNFYLYMTKKLLRNRSSYILSFLCDQKWLKRTIRATVPQLNRKPAVRALDLLGIKVVGGPL